MRAIGFVILFPIFLVYQLLVQAGVMAPVLGGYFTVGSLIAMPFALYALIKEGAGGKKYKSVVFLVYMAILIYMLGVAYFGFMAQVDEGIVFGTVLTVLRIVSIFLVIMVFDFNDKLLNRLLWWFFIGYSISVLSLSVGGEFVVRGLEFGGEIFQVDYQTTAVVYIMMGVILVAQAALYQRVLLYLISIAVLFVVGARSEFVGFFVLIFLIELMLSKSPVTYLAKILPLLFVGIASLTLLYASYPEHRIFNLLNLGSDLSAVARNELSANAWATIQESPFFGGYGSYIHGQYAHNILAAWVDLGLIGFALVLFALMIHGYLIVRGRVRRWEEGGYVRAASLYFFVVLMLITAKTYTYPMIPIAVAFYLIFRSEYMTGKEVDEK